MTNSPLGMLFDEDAILMYGDLPYDGVVVYIAGSPASLGAAEAVGARVGEARWAAGAASPVEESRATPMEWRFARPADITRTFAAWC